MNPNKCAGSMHTSAMSLCPLTRISGSWKTAVSAYRSLRRQKCRRFSYPIKQRLVQNGSQNWSDLLLLVIRTDGTRRGAARRSRRSAVQRLQCCDSRLLTC